MSGTHYGRGERQAASIFRGLVYSPGGGEYLLLGFGINGSALAPEHRVFLRSLVATHHLADTNADAQIELIEGYTDAVDSQGGNARLRSERADSVARALHDLGTPGSRIGTIRGAPEGTYLQGNEAAAGRTANRAVRIRLVPLQGRPLQPVPIPPEPPAAGRPGSRLWAIQSSESIMLGRVFGGGVAHFFLRNRTTNVRYEFIFTGAGFAGGLPLPSRLPQPPHVPPRVGFSAPSETPFHTNRAVWPEDFDGLPGVLMTIGIGALAGGYGEGFLQLSTPFLIMADSGGIGPFPIYRGTNFLDIGGMQAGGGIGPEGAAILGLFTRIGQ